jgi:hypothetical protein
VTDAGLKEVDGLKDLDAGLKISRLPEWLPFNGQPFWQAAFF